MNIPVSIPTCIDCKHSVWPVPGFYVVDWSPKCDVVRLPMDPVTGARYMRDCASVRKDPYSCGPFGAMFVAKPPVPPKPERLHTRIINRLFNWIMSL